MSMKIPPPETNARKVIDTIEPKESLSLDEAIAIHGLFSRSPARTEDLYSRMVADGFLLFYNDKYYLSSITTGLLKKERGAEEPKNIAGIRMPTPFTEIKKKNIPSALGPRERYGR